MNHTALAILKILLTLFSIQVLIKFSFFFVLSYNKRRKMLDKSYGNKSSATKTSDYVLLAITIILAALLFLSDKMEYISFTAGLWIGATLIQIYFHSFSTPLSPEKAPKQPISPIKMMSYAIQANPEKPWKELIVLALLFGWALYMFLTTGFGLFG